MIRTTAHVIGMAAMNGETQDMSEIGIEVGKGGLPSENMSASVIGVCERKPDRGSETRNERLNMLIRRKKSIRAAAVWGVRWRRWALWPCSSRVLMARSDFWKNIETTRMIHATHETVVVIFM